AFLKDMKSTAREIIPKKLKMTYALEQGMTSDAILTYSRLYKPGLIVVGAKGVGNRMEFLGSSTIRIILKASFPVLIIPEESQISKDKTSLKIVYATNYDEYDFFEISRLIRLFWEFSLEIFCTHIGMEDEPIEKLKMKALLEYFEKSYPKVKIHCNMLEDHGIEASLDQYISEHNIDILAMTTHKRNLLTKIISPSITKKVYYHTRIPLLIFHS
ncbi:MAG: universal stress protein, partial [Bacteroidota bacterium]|nr:universal stress protein [Bacteroidota bacterium]